VRSAATDVIPELATLGKVHIMGIAGSGMSALARILLERGIDVSGCEARDSLGVAGLRALGADVRIGHSPDHVDDCDTFVYTTAINPNHPEFAYARERAAGGSTIVLRRAAALAAALEGRHTIAISGTHGKTSTTSLLTVAAQACGLDPSFAIGGNLYESGKNAHLGTGELAIVEADESDGSFLLTRPFAAIVTNVEADHLENHGDLEGIFSAFEQFVDRIVATAGGAGDAVPHAAGSVPDAAGLLLICQDDPGARRIGEYARARGVRVRTYGTSTDSDVVVSGIEALVASAPSLPDAAHLSGVPNLTSAPPLPSGVAFTVSSSQLGTRHVAVGSLIGSHMALNAAAALALAAELGWDVDTAIGSWASFGGVHRRMEWHGEGGGVRVFDDYAHHPTEVAAQLSAARALLAPRGGTLGSGGVAAGGARLIGVFQPGTYSRTQTFAHEFAEAMAIADIAVLMDVFPAREEPIPGVTGATIADLVRLPAEQVIYEPSFAAVPARIAQVARPGDVVLTMGIGNVYQLCEEIRLACAQAAVDEAS
jgi:UDP-N-acetylmuramate--alanine ligase